MSNSSVAVKPATMADLEAFISERSSKMTVGEMRQFDRHAKVLVEESIRRSDASSSAHERAE